ncbi:MAG: 4-hydroxy-tetrahydrodipicolinate reductase [Candidatus Goldbacteria bacterium]|nr:4-hydroxy-tetrahydrodipicolinate reductase [Candidatus Goldiibacteriota bacterium]
MIRIGISGAAGRMGKSVAAVISRGKDFKIAALVERKGHELVGKEVEGVKVTDDLESVVNDIDVYIDFSVPQASLEALEILSSAGKAHVLATTGFTKEELLKIDEAAKKIPVVFASNYSVGVNVMWKVLDQVTRIMKDDYDIDIVESHHRHKKDAPSGTAVTCAQVIMDAKGLDYDENVIYGRDGRDNERPRNQLGVFAVRGGGVIGEHTVMYMSDEDKLEIKHTIFSRDALAAGAVKAAKFINGKKAGLYSMKDVLGL